MSSIWNTAESLLLGSSPPPPPDQNNISNVVNSQNNIKIEEESMVGSHSSDISFQSHKSEMQVNLSSVSTPEASSPTINSTSGPGWLRGAGGGGGAARGRGTSLPAAVAEGLARHKAHQQLIYKHKYNRLKRIVKDLVLENAALCDQVADVQQQVLVGGEERRGLIRRLSHYQGHSHLQAKAQPSIQTPNDVGDIKNGNATNTQRNTKHVVKKRTEIINSLTSGPTGSTSSGRSKLKKSRSGKPKRLCPPITLDSAGRPIFPITLGPLTVHSLGEIVAERDSYHRENVIFPVGFCSSRTYASLSDPRQSALYTCKIMEGGNAPKFEVVCEEEDESIFTGSSPTECHSLILKTVNAALGMDLLNVRPDSHEADERGLRFFGLSHPSVQNVLQACPGARKCTKYKWVRFEVCRSEAEVDSVFEAEREASLCHEALLRNIRFARHHVPN